MKHSIIYTLSLFTLMGCQNAKMPPVHAPVDNATIKLAEAADSISHSLLQLSKIQAAATPPKHKPLVSPNSLEMTNRASVDWSGPVGPLVERITKASHHKLRVLGSPPAIPVLVSVTTRNARLGDILRDIDFQAGEKAHIRVYAKSKTVELRYAKT